MSYRLKVNVADFVYVDGPFAGRSFKAGKTYAEIPPGEAYKFNAIPDQVEEMPVPAGKNAKKAASSARKGQNVTEVGPGLEQAEEKKGDSQS